MLFAHCTQNGPNGKGAMQERRISSYLSFLLSRLIKSTEMKFIYAFTQLGGPNQCLPVAMHALLYYQYLSALVCACVHFRNFEPIVKMIGTQAASGAPLILITDKGDKGLREHQIT
jgi:hypothetical protein